LNKWGVARFLPDGSLDTSFDSDGWLTTDFAGADSVPADVAVANDGRIVVAGIAGSSGSDFAISVFNGGKQRLYAQQDANYNVTSVTDDTGAVQERYLYDPYGAVTYKSPTWGSQSPSFSWVYLHQGGRYDGSSKLYDFRNRSYSPSLGRWTQRDPLGFWDGLNQYASMRSNPATLIDPYGLAALPNYPENGVTSPPQDNRPPEPPEPHWYQNIVGHGPYEEDLNTYFPRRFPTTTSDIKGRFTNSIDSYIRGSVKCGQSSFPGNKALVENYPDTKHPKKWMGQGYRFHPGGVMNGDAPMDDMLASRSLGSTYWFIEGNVDIKWTDTGRPCDGGGTIHEYSWSATLAVQDGLGSNDNKAMKVMRYLPIVPTLVIAWGVAPRNVIRARYKLSGKGEVCCCSGAAGGSTTGSTDYLTSTAAHAAA
jgi:RHS repeat-associated protein